MVEVTKLPFSIGRGRTNMYRIAEMKISSKYEHRKSHTFLFALASLCDPPVIQVSLL